MNLFSRTICIAASSLLPLVASARDGSAVAGRHWEIGLDGAVAGDFYSVSPSVAFWGFPYAGVRLSLGTSNNPEGLRINDIWWDPDNGIDVDWEYTEESHLRFMSRLGITLRYPSLARFYDGDLLIGLQAEPAVVLSPKGRGRRWQFWDVRLTIPVIVSERWIFSAGYVMTDYDLYSDDPPLGTGGYPLPAKNRISHGVALSVAVSF